MTESSNQEQALMLKGKDPKLKPTSNAPST